MPASDLVPILAPWVGREAGAAELTQAIAAVTAHLRRAGLLVAQAALPAQEIRDGIIDIVVFEGRIGTVTVDAPDGTRLKPSVTRRFLANLRPDDTIRRDNVEQSLLLLNDLPGIQVNASLAASARAGSADLLASIENQGNPLTATFTLDNAGLRATGEIRANVDVRWRSPLGLGDLLSLRVLGSDTGGQTLGILTYGLPLNGAGTRVGLRLGEQHYRLGREFAVLNGHGRQGGASVMVSHPLIRRIDHNLFVSAFHIRFDFSDRLDTVGFASDSRQQITGAGLALDWRDTWLGGGASLLQTQYLAGRTRLDTPALAALDLAPGGLNVQGSYSVLRFRAQRTQAIDPRSHLLIAINGQAASKNLDAGTEMAIGGPDAVRAYPVGELFADQGILTRIEYTRAFNLIERAPTSISLFFDHARVDINRNPLPGGAANKRSFAGYGAGLRQAIGANATIQSSIAWRATEAPASEADRRPRLWLSLMVRI